MYLDGGQVTQETTIFDLTGKQYGFFESGSERISIGSFREFDVSLNTRRWHRGGIAEILVYSTVDASQRSEVEEYLNDKYFDPAATPPPLPDLPPTGLQCQAKLDGSEVTLNWKPCGVYNSQQILRDGEEIASVAGDASTFVDEDPTIGTVTYVIEASPSGGGELLSGECVVDVVLPFFEGRILHLAADQGVVSGDDAVWIDYIVFPPLENSSECSTGDLNQDSSINIQDIVLLINLVLSSNGPNELQVCLSDLNQDGILNVLDVVLLVNLILR